MSTEMSERGGGASPKKPLVGIPLVVALLAIVLWLGAMMWAYVEIDAQEPRWSRLILIFNSIQAVGFAAAGALFGTTVQMPRVAAAEQRAEKAKKGAKNLAETVKKEAQARGFDDSMRASLVLADQILSE